jgi:transcriptional adapter 3
VVLFYDAHPVACPHSLMAPASSQKGTGKKGAGAIARQRSRNTTPSSVPPPASLPPIDNKQTEYLELSYDSFRNLTYEDVVDQTAIPSGMPESKNLDGMMTRLQRLQDTLERRHNFCDRGMRLLVPLLRARMDDERSREEERLRREAAEDDERARKANKANKANKKKRKATDSLAPHDSNLGQSSIAHADFACPPSSMRYSHTCSGLPASLPLVFAFGLHTTCLSSTVLLV